MKLSAALKITKNALLSDVEYRLNYFLMIFSGTITVALEAAIFRHLYQNQEQIGFLPKSQAFAFVVMGMLLRHAFSDWSVNQEFISEIKSGTFRRFLLQPLHFPSFLYASLVGHKVVVWAISILVIILLKVSGTLPGLLPASYLHFAVLSFVFAIFLAWQCYLLMLMLSFWLHEAGFLMIAFNIGVGVFSGSLLPLDWLPGLLQKLIALTPFPLLGDVPMRASLGLISQQEWLGKMLLALLWGLGLVALNHLLWKKGTRHYEAFGG